MEKGLRKEASLYTRTHVHDRDTVACTHM